MLSRPFMELNRPIFEGPLVKSQKTKEIEALLTAIVENYHSTSIAYIDGEYEVTVNGQAINLSFALKYADLQQLEISENTINKMTEILNRQTLQSSHIPDGKSATALLKPIHRQAIYYYTGKKYKKIGKLFRGEEISEHGNLVDIFLIGCLLCDGVNKLPSLMDSEILYHEEREILNKLQKAAIFNYRKNHISPFIFLDKIHDEDTFVNVIKLAKSEGVISSKEYLILESKFKKLRPYLGGYQDLYRYEEIPLKVLQNRLNSESLALPSVTSCSYDQETKLGSHLTLFKAPRTVTIKSISKHPEENEILLPAGLQVSYEIAVSGASYHRASMIQTTKISDRFWPEHALRYAANLILNEPYQHELDTEIIGGVTVHRPNHGLAHTFRVMTYVPRVLNYFEKHASNQEFKKFCKEMDSYLYDWLEIAAVFSISGRESEISFGENKELYFTYRQKSKNQFKEFVNSQCPLPSDPQRRKNIIRLADVILYMGNPEYTKRLAKLKNKNEIKIREYLHAILSMAHKLDLPRCYTYPQYLASLAFLDKIIVASEEEKNDRNVLMSYATRAIKSHGDCLGFIINDDGSMMPVDQNYLALFGIYSTEVASLLANECAMEELDEYLKYSPDELLNMLPGIIENELLKEKNLLYLLKTLPMEYFIKACQVNLANGKKMISLFANQSQYLKDLLEHLPNNNLQIKLIAEENSNGLNLLHEVSLLPESLDVALSFLSEEQIIHHLIRSRGYHPSPIELASRIPDSLNLIFKKYSLNQCYNKIILPCDNQQRSLLIANIANPDSLKIILSKYPRQKLVKALTEQSHHDGHSFLYHVTPFTASLNVVMQSLTPGQRKQIINIDNDINPSLLHTVSNISDSLHVVLASLSPIKNFNPGLFTDTSGQSLLERALFHPTFKNIANHVCLQALLTLIPQADLYSLINKIGFNGETILHLATPEPLNLHAILCHLKKNEQMSAVKLKNSQGETAFDLACMLGVDDSIATFFNIFPQSQRLALVTKLDHAGIPIFHRAIISPKAVRTILNGLTPVQKFRAIRCADRGETLLHKAIMYPESFFVILNCLQPSQRKAAMMFQNHLGSSVYQLANLFFAAEYKQDLDALFAGEVIPNPQPMVFGGMFRLRKRVRDESLDSDEDAVNQPKKIAKFDK